MASFKVFVLFTGMHVTEEVSAKIYTRLNGPTGVQTETLNSMMLMIMMKRRFENFNKK
jgi:hypothetical protein